MILAIRRMVLLVSLMFWQGGFMFYGGVVVPVGGRILGSETRQGFITQSVTNYLNLAGARSASSCGWSICGTTDEMEFQNLNGPYGVSLPFQ